MKIIIESPHFTLSQQLEDYTIQKVGKLSHFDENLIKSDVLLKIENSGTDDNKVCEIRVKNHGTNLFASSKNLTFEEAVIHCVHALEKQLKKYKIVARRDGKKMETDSAPDETMVL